MNYIHHQFVSKCRWHAHTAEYVVQLEGILRRSWSKVANDSEGSQRHM